MNENSKGELCFKELNSIKKTKFFFRGSFSEMHKLALVKPLYSAHPFLAASLPAANCQKITKDERTHPPIPEDISYHDTTDKEPIALASTIEVQELIDPTSMPKILDEKESFVANLEMVMSMLDLSLVLLEGKTRKAMLWNIGDRAKLFFNQ